MDTIRKVFVAIGAGTVLGLAFWALASWDGVGPITWIILGVVIMVSMWLDMAIASRRSRMDR